MTASTPPERPAKKMHTSIQIPVKLRARLAVLTAREQARTGRSVSYAEIIEKLLDKQERK